MGREQLVLHGLDVVCILMGFNVGHGTVVVAGPQFLDELSAFICHEVHVEHLPSVAENSDGSTLAKVKVG